MFHGRKIAGVLVETKALEDTVEFAVVGIGINVNTDKKDLPAGASSLYLETQKKHSIEQIFRKLIKEFSALYARFKKDSLNSLLREAYPHQVKNSLKKISGAKRRYVSESIN